MGCPSASEILRSQPPVGRVGLVGRPREGEKLHPTQRVPSSEVQGQQAVRSGREKSGHVGPHNFAVKIAQDTTSAANHLFCFIIWFRAGSARLIIWKILKGLEIQLHMEVSQNRGNRVTPNHRFSIGVFHEMGMGQYL